MYFTSRKQKQQRAILQDNVAYPEATIKEYLNIRRATKDKICLVSFCIYILVVIMLLGIGFFYGNYQNIGVFLSTNGPNQPNCQYINENLSCTTVCGVDSIAFLQKICIPKNYSPNFSTALTSQIEIYNLQQSFITMVYSNIGILIGILFLFVMLIFFQKLLYFYIFLTFSILLAFSFYLLKSIEERVKLWNGMGVFTGILIDNQQRFTSLAYILLAAYLVLFPIILFSPKKIKIAVKILANMQHYFETMFTVTLFTILITITSYGLIFLFAFLLMNFFTDGSPVQDPSSFFYLYEKVYLSHPVALAFFFIGTIWLFGTLVSWHKYFIGSSILQWYFEDGGKIQPVRKGLKRAWYNLGSAAIDALLTPLEWVILILYSFTKLNSETIQEYESYNDEDCLCCSNCLYSFRTMISKIYCKININASSTGALTNHTYTESCQIAAVTFSEKGHKFFSIGGDINLYLTSFSTLIFIFINYLSLFNTIYTNKSPPIISSLSLPILLSASLGLVVGQLMSNLFSASLDCLLFCFLIQKKNGVEYRQNPIKKILEQIYNTEQQVEEVHQMYEIQTEQ